MSEKMLSDKAEDERLRANANWLSYQRARDERDVAERKVKELEVRLRDVSKAFDLVEAERDRLLGQLIGGKP